jgi:hypothetical protein
VNGKLGFNPVGNREESGTQDVPRQIKTHGLECMVNGVRKKLIFSLEQHTTVFQAKVHANKASAVENTDNDYRTRDTSIYILSDSQVAITAFDNYQINSELVWDR